MAYSVMIVGTDTGVGKTILTAAIASYSQQFYPSCKLAIYKPIQSGVGDREFYQQHCQLTQSPEEITPIYLQHPLAPPIAAEKETKDIQLSVIWRVYQELLGRYDLVLVESLGGLGSPITNDYIVADLAADWRIPTILVSEIKLGCLSQIIAHVTLAKSHRVNCSGIVLNNRQPEVTTAEFAPIPVIENLTCLPVLGILPFIPNPYDRTSLAQAFASMDNFPMQKLLGLG